MPAQTPLGPAKAVATKLANTRRIFSSRSCSLQNVSVLQGKSSIEIHIEGSANLKPVASHLNAPERIIVDLPQVRYDRTNHIPVNAEDVGEVRVGLYRSDPPTTRVVVELKQPHAYRVLASGKTVILQIDIAASDAGVRAATVITTAAPAAPIAPTIPTQTGTALSETRTIEPFQPEPSKAQVAEPETISGADDSAGQQQPPAPAAPTNGISPEPMPIPQVATVYAPPPPIPQAQAPSDTKPVEEETTAHQAAKGNKPGVVRTITVGREKEGIEVHIEGSKPLKASATTLQNPERIVIDLADVRFDHPKRIPVNAGHVRDVIVALYLVNPLTTRVVVSLDHAHPYRLVNSGNTLTVRIDPEEITRAEKSGR